ncbi:MAG: CDP-alcohol phosphatidyltransferase family protein [Oscillospiraceae bacterium]|nr:CDP-alcohol phosphatidyltransferase family protein [Oscillospiraceae bacterium]
MRHIPNLLSSFRILLIPFFAAYVVRGEMIWAAIVLIISGLTDLLDGFLARRFQWVSQLGKILDPVADKLTQITVCVLFFWFFGYQFRLFFAFLIFKELAMLVTGAYLLRKDVKLNGARWFGKVATVLFYATMILIALFPALPIAAKYAMLILICICELVSGLKYLPEFRLYRQQTKMAE